MGNIAAVVTLRFKVPNCIDEGSVDEFYGGDLAAWIREMLEDYTLSEYVCPGDVEIVSVFRAED